MSRHYQKDYLFGIQEQKNIFDTIKEYFQSQTFRETTEKYSKYDFEDDTHIFELKSRKCKKNTYPTTLLTCNKIIKSSKEQIFIFNFTDEICYLKYDEKIFNTFDKKPYSRKYFETETDMLEYYFIPLENLTTLKLK